MVFMDPKGVRDQFIDLETGGKSPQGEEKAEVEKVRVVEKVVGAEEEKEKKKKSGGKKPPKPPRPPKAPSLDAADRKLIREMAQIAMLKKARMERMRALKKVKNAKAASANSNLWALVITVVFCIVVIWQGVFSRGGLSWTLQGSSEPSIHSRGSLISSQFYRNIRTDRPHGSSSASPNNVT